MKNISSSSETAPEVQSAFSTQPHSGGSPSAPSCNHLLPAPAPVGLRMPRYQTAAQHAGAQTDRREQTAEIDEDAVMVGDEVEMSEVRPAEKPARRGGSKSMKT
jgi:hypothetical protein